MPSSGVDAPRTAAEGASAEQDKAAVAATEAVRGGVRQPLQRPATAAAKTGKDVAAFSAHLGTFPNAGLQGLCVTAFELPSFNETFDLTDLISTRLYGLSEESRQRRQKRATSAAFRREGPRGVIAAADADVLWMFKT